MNYLNYCSNDLISKGKLWADFLATIKDNFVCDTSNTEIKIRLIHGEVISLSLTSSFFLEGHLDDTDVSLSDMFTVQGPDESRYGFGTTFLYQGSLNNRVFLDELFKFLALKEAIPKLPGRNLMTSEGE